MRGALVFCIVSTVLGISINMDNKYRSHCSKVEIQEHFFLKGSYFISGESEGKTLIRVYTFFTIDIQSSI